MIAREKLPSLSFPTGVSQVDTASREKATIAVNILLHYFNHFGCHLRHCIRNCNLATLRRYHFHCRPRSSLPFVCTKQCIHERETVQVLLGRVAIYTSAGAAEVFGIFTNDGKLKNNLNNISDNMFILGIGHWHLHQQWHHPRRWPCCVKLWGAME